MIDLVVTRGHETQASTLVLPERAFIITVGRTSPSDLVIDSPLLSRSHARLEARDDECWVEDAGSASGTLVDDRRTGGRVWLAPGSRVDLGDVTLRFEPQVLGVLATFMPADATEVALMRACAHDEADARAVYADWLEERGHEARAAYMRARTHLVGWDFDQRAHLGVLAAAVDVGWRILIG